MSREINNTHCAVTHSVCPNKIQFQLVKNKYLKYKVLSHSEMAAKDRDLILSSKQ